MHEDQVFLQLRIEILHFQFGLTSLINSEQCATLAYSLKKVKSKYNIKFARNPNGC